MKRIYASGIRVGLHSFLWGNHCTSICSKRNCGAVGTVQQIVVVRLHCLLHPSPTYTTQHNTSLPILILIAECSKSAIHLAIVLTFESLRRHLKGKCGSENGIRVPVPLPPHASTLMFSYRSCQCVWWWEWVNCLRSAGTYVSKPRLQ